MSLLFDLWQQREIQNTRQVAERASERNSQTRDDIHSLSRKIETLALTNQALYEILRDHLGITEAQVIQKMKEIDRRDGSTNGMMNPVLASCRKCGRQVNTSMKKCIHCGEGVTEGHLFQKL